MATHLRQEFEAEVRETKPWGLLVELENVTASGVTTYPGRRTGSAVPGQPVKDPGPKRPHAMNAASAR